MEKVERLMLVFIPFFSVVHQCMICYQFYNIPKYAKIRALNLTVEKLPLHTEKTPPNGKAAPIRSLHNILIERQRVHSELHSQLDLLHSGSFGNLARS